MSAPLTLAQVAADALLAALRAELCTHHPDAAPEAAAGCAVTSVVGAVRRSREGATPVLTALTDMAYALGLQLTDVDPQLREGVLRVIKNRLNDGARRAGELAGASVH